MSGLKKFVLRGNLLDLAVAVVIGVAFGAVINAFIRDLVTPLLAAIGGKPDFAALYFTVNGSRFLIGDFIDALLAFLLIAAVIYYIVVSPYVRIQERTHRGEEEADSTISTCPECLSQIPSEARRCRFCGSEVAAASRKPNS